MKLKNFTAITLALLSISVKLNAQSPAREFVPFTQFLARTKAMDSSHMRMQSSRVRDSRSFDAMRKHVLSMYEGVHVSHSFVQGASHVDCVPIAEQPTIRQLGLKAIEEAPPESMLATHKAEEDKSAGLSSSPTFPEDSVQGMDEFGNQAFCEAASIPMRRIEMEELMQFPTLEDFFRKKPAGSLTAEEAPATAGATHKYSIFRQYVDNAGANSSINLWSPYVNTSVGQIFSLFQQWYVGGSGAALQTAEVGWQNYPAKYGDQRSRLFIYYTADNYVHTGCYNHDCAAFVQTSNTATLGGAFTNYSVYGGTQYDFSAQFYLYNGNWWLAIQGTWIGYYPGSLYRGGQLSRFAQRIDFGTETVGTTTWPGAGSGAWSTAGWSRAAYQRNLYYIRTTGGTVWDSLSPIDPSPACYNTSGPYYSSSAGWGIYFYAGGPGGSGCQ